MSNSTHTVTQTELNKLNVTNVIHEMSEDLEFNNDISQFDFVHNHIVVTTGNQLWICDPNNVSSKVKVEITDPVNFFFSSAG